MPPRSPAATAHGSRGGALPGLVGASLVDEIAAAYGAHPDVVLIRNPMMHATLKSGGQCLTGIGGKGAADLHLEVRCPCPGGDLWALLWVEAKAGSGELSKDQARWHAALEWRGRHHVVARSVADVGAAIAELRARAGGAR